MNIPLFSAIFSIAATVIIGVLMIVLFVNDLSSLTTVIGAVIVGALVSIPIALIVTKRMSTLTNAPTPTPKQPKPNP